MRFIANKLGRLLTLGRIFSTQTLKLSLDFLFSVKNGTFRDNDRENYPLPKKCLIFNCFSQPFLPIQWSVPKKLTEESNLSIKIKFFLTKVSHNFFFKIIDCKNFGH